MREGEGNSGWLLLLATPTALRIVSHSICFTVSRFFPLYFILLARGYTYLRAPPVRLGVSIEPGLVNMNEYLKATKVLSRKSYTRRFSNSLLCPREILRSKGKTGSGQQPFIRDT